MKYNFFYKAKKTQESPYVCIESGLRGGEIGVVAEESEPVFWLDELFLQQEDGLGLALVDVGHLLHQLLCVLRGRQCFVWDVSVLVNQAGERRQKHLPRSNPGSTKQLFQTRIIVTARSKTKHIKELYTFF